MIARFFRWLFSPPQAPAPSAPADLPPPRESFFSTDLEVTRREPIAGQWLARLNERAFPKTIRDSYVMTGDGAGLHTYAEDTSDGQTSLKAIFAMSQIGVPEAQALWYGSQGFIGYQMCALMAQHWLVNKCCLIPARDAIRKGFKLTVNDGTDLDPKILAAITKANKRYRLARSLVEYVKTGRTFGVRVALFKVESTDPDYYVKPFNPDAITPGSYRGISQIDPYWVIPELTSATASDPSALDFYEPTYWIINGKRYHKSHLVILRGPEVADVLKPSYLYGGLSVPQMIYERVYASERTANEAPQLALTKRAMIFYTDAAKALANQATFEDRLAVWATYRDNFGVKVADKEADQIEQHDTSLADLDAVIMSQYQLVAAAANIPATKLLGTTPKGFNSSGDYEADSYHEELESIQTNDMEPLIERHLVCLIRSEIAPRFGIAPFDVDVTWAPINSLGEKEAAEVQKIKADTDKTLFDAGAIDGEDIRARISADEHSGHNGLAMAVAPDVDQEA